MGTEGSVFLEVESGAVYSEAIAGAFTVAEAFALSLVPALALCQRGMNVVASRARAVSARFLRALAVANLDILE